MTEAIHEIPEISNGLLAAGEAIQIRWSFAVVVRTFGLDLNEEAGILKFFRRRVAIIAAIAARFAATRHAASAKSTLAN
jgi:hypothetical protein